MSRSGFTLVDFTIPTRNNTMTHEATEAPLCEDCKARDLCFFDPTCGGCQDLLLDSSTSIPQLFAVMRQWVPQTQRNMSSLAREVLRRGANVNDRDGLTDLSLLHFACKSGATGVGNVTSAVNLVNSLINKGADCELRCKWTNMNALHYAVFFDVPEIVQTLLEHQPALLQSVCDEYNGGTALHIASANVSLRSTEILLSHGAKCSVTDNSGHTPMDLLPSNQQTGGEGEMAERVSQMAAILKSALEKEEEEEEEEVRQSEKKEREEDKENAMEVESTTEEPQKPKTPLGKPPPSPVPKSHSSPLTIKKTHSPRVREPVRTRGTRSPVSTVSTVSSGSSRTASPAAEEVTMATLGMKIGDHILIDAKTSSSKAKNGTIRFGGSTEFATGQWAGIELDEPIGKNDGSCMGIRYFTCKAKFGLFVPMHRVSKATQSPSTERRKKSINGKKDAMSPRTFEAQGTMHVTTDLQVGERVMVSGSRTGTLRYAGTVKFAPGIWMGVELDNPHGKNDGSRSGVRYFKCKQNHGVFVLPSKVKRMPPVATSGSSYTGSSASGTDSTDYHPSTSSSSPSPHTSPTVNKRRLNVSNAKSAPRAKHPRTTPHPAPHSSSSAAPLSLSSLPDVTLETGMNVFVSGEFGVVKFIGHTSFSEGVWLGVELRRPNGKNDGTVKGKRYFHCRPSHGLFVKPEKSTHRGINCAKILPENLVEKTS